MGTLLIVALVAILLFGSVLLFGAPYVPTMKKQADTAFKLLNLKKGQTLLELGSGDGRILLEAAKRGYNVVGYEINPVLVLWSKLVTWRHRDKVTVHWGNFWNKDWPKADGIYVFLLQNYMEKLDTKITRHVAQQGSIKLVSFAFEIPGKKPKKHGGGMSLYEYKGKPNSETRSKKQSRSTK